MLPPCQGQDVLQSLETTAMGAGDPRETAKRHPWLPKTQTTQEKEQWCLGRARAGLGQGCSSTSETRLPTQPRCAHQCRANRRRGQAWHPRHQLPRPGFKVPNPSPSRLGCSLCQKRGLPLAPHFAQSLDLSGKLSTFCSYSNSHPHVGSQ